MIHRGCYSRPVVDDVPMSGQKSEDEDEDDDVQMSGTESEDDDDIEMGGWTASV